LRDDDEVEVRGWDFSGQVLAAKVPGRSGKDEWADVLPFNLVPRRVLADEDGNVQGFEVKFKWVDGRASETTIPGSFLGSPMRTQVLAQLGIHLLPEQAKVVAEFLSAVLSGYSNLSHDRVVTRAEWIGDELNLPNATYPAAPWLAELDAYGRVGEEAGAREAWQEIVRTAMQWPRAMCVLGMPFATIYLKRMAAENFALHVTGESHSGKTLVAELAMSELSSAQCPHGALYRTWNASEKAPQNLMKLVGVLPVWLDETATAGLDDERFTNSIFQLAQGRARMVADKVGGLEPGGGIRWDACLLSTGEARLSNKSGLTGMRRRVFELYAPIFEDGSGETIDELVALARKHFGWPLRWLAADPHPDRARASYERLLMAAAPAARGQQVELAQAGNVAACMAGFAELGRACGVKVPERALKDGVLFVFEKLVRASADEGADVGERALRALKEALNTRSQNFLDPEERADATRERWGVTFEDGVVGITGEATLAHVLGEFGRIEDIVPALEKLKKMGVLIHDAGRATGRRRIWVPGRGLTMTRLYLFKLSERGRA
jgi:hypothetical protein